MCASRPPVLFLKKSRKKWFFTGPQGGFLHKMSARFLDKMSQVTGGGKRLVGPPCAWTPPDTFWQIFFKICVFLCFPGRTWGVRKRWQLFWNFLFCQKIAVFETCHFFDFSHVAFEPKFQKRFFKISNFYIGSRTGKKFRKKMKIFDFFKIYEQRV